MFEKEAIRHAFEDTIGVKCLLKPVEDFTYEELSDEQQEKAYDFKKGAEFGYNKANEWHYVKDGDLPKKTDKYLVYIINGYGCKSIELIQYNNGRHFWCVDCQNEVIAWKEIVLPNEI